MKQGYYLIFVLYSLFGGQAYSQNVQDAAEHKVRLTDKLLKNLGGIDLWKNTRSIQLKERMYYKLMPEAVIQEIWRDLKNPATKFHLSNSSMDRMRASDAYQGWGTLENGKSYVYDKQRVENEVLGWKKNLFTICYKIANSDPSIYSLEKDETILEVFDTKNELLCTIELNVHGAPIKWTAQIGDTEESYIYGPLKQFGNYNLPSWWTSVDGHWQFEYISFISSHEAPAISFLPPEGFKTSN